MHQCPRCHSSWPENRNNLQHGRYEEFRYVQGIFDSFGGTRQLALIDEIKKELMENGPVVSTLFILSQAFLTAGEYSQSLFQSRIGKTHELLIVGWKLTAFGEVWLAKSLKDGIDEQPIRIAFGQFGVDDICLAPTNSFENYPWQSGPCFYIAMRSHDGWMGWSGMIMDIGSNELEAIARCFSSGLHAAIEQRSPLVIREKKKVARSRRYRLVEVEWNNEKARWEVKVSRVS